MTFYGVCFLTETSMLIFKTVEVIQRYMLRRRQDTKMFYKVCFLTKTSFSIVKIIREIQRCAQRYAEDRKMPRGSCYSETLSVGVSSAMGTPVCWLKEYSSGMNGGRNHCKIFGTGQFKNAYSVIAQ